MHSLQLTASQILEYGFPLAVGISLLGGILTSLTPCVYPLIPITVGIMGAQKAASTSKSFALSLFFVLGLALIYSVLGFSAASAGILLGSLNQNVWVVGSIALLFFVMGLSLLGLFEFRLPHRCTQWLATQGGTGFFGSFVLGGATGLLAAPCAGPVVAGILAFVALGSHPMRGFFLLFSFSLGLGLPFLLLGTFSHLAKQVPRSGLWTVWIKNLCGIALIFAGYWYLRPLFPPYAWQIAVALGLVISALFLPKILPSSGSSSVTPHSLGRIALALLAGVLLIPKGALRNDGPGRSGAARIAWLSSESDGLKKAVENCKPLIIDFFADWCEACHELDRATYADTRVQKMIRDGFVPIKIDATKMNGDVQKTLMKYGVFGLPTVLFLNPNGDVYRDLTLTGFLPADEFLELLYRATSQTGKC
ncbi:MAG TPA: cytochrome c biogenesis protein CcdA [Bdellovibrionota bacterium]|nr:cytochrome c biogenesis protein CcdA [Bdellovibrionota bacterium]